MGTNTIKPALVLTLVTVALFGAWGEICRADNSTSQSVGSFIDDCSQGNLGNVIKRISSGVSVNSRRADGQTALAAAVLHQRTEIVKILLKHGAQVDRFTDNNGRTLLMLAVLSAPYNHAELDAKNMTSFTAPSPTKRDIQNEILEVLMAHGAPFDREDLDGETALTLAAGQGRASVVLQLVRNGVPINQRNRAGKTALMLAAHDGDKDLVEKLILVGADASLRDNLGQTASDLAEAWRFPEVVRLLDAEMQRKISP